MRVLLVEDEFLIALDVKVQLESAGHEVVGLAAGLAQANDLLDAHEVDLAVLDMNLRGDTSFPIAERLAAAGTPFMFLSGNDAARLPADFSTRPVLTKPIDYKKLLDTINTLGPA